MVMDEDVYPSCYVQTKFLKDPKYRKLYCRKRTFGWGYIYLILWHNLLHPVWRVIHGSFPLNEVLLKNGELYRISVFNFRIFCWKKRRHPTISLMSNCVS
jgi:hypothetical protein